MQNKAYLGDGLYAEHDGYQFWLTTQQYQSVALEPDVLDNFLRYVEKIWECKITMEKLPTPHREESKSE